MLDSEQQKTLCCSSLQDLLVVHQITVLLTHDALLRQTVSLEFQEGLCRCLQVSGHPAVAPHMTKFYGIRNGIDQDIWDPLEDRFLPRCTQLHKKI